MVDQVPVFMSHICLVSIKCREFTMEQNLRTKVPGDKKSGLATKCPVIVCFLDTPE